MTFNPSPWASVKWTEAEENRLWRLRAIYGNCTWGEFAKLGFFPGRSTGAISRKYYALRDESSEARTRQPASILSRTTLCGRASAKRFMEPNLVIPDPRPQKRPTLRDENGQYPAIHTDRPREITATSVNRSASSRNTMFPTRTETAYPVENGNMTDPEASDDPGDIEFDGSTRRLHRGRRSQGTNGSPSRRSQITASPSQSPSTRPPPISHPARWCWESSSPSPRHRQRHPSPAIKVQEVDDFESSGNANAETVHTPEDAHTISQVLDRFLEIDSSDGRACLPPDPAVHAQPARISFQLPASSANSSGPKRVMTSIPVYRNSLEELTSASNSNPVKPSHTPAFTTPNPSPPEITAEKLNKEPRTVANIEQPTSRRPAGNTRCLIDAAEKVVQCARFLDHDNESRTRREAQLQEETAALKKVTRNLELSLQENEMKCEKLETELRDLTKEVCELKKDLETARGHQELLREFVVQMVTVLLAKTGNVIPGRSAHPPKYISTVELEAIPNNSILN